MPHARRLAVPLLAVLAGLAAAPTGVLASAAAASTTPYIVILKKSSAPAARAATSDIAQDEGFRTTQRYDDTVHGFAARLDKRDLAAVREDPRVSKVVKDRPVEASGLVPIVAGDNIPTGVRRSGAAVGATVRQASTVNVAVIDTGIDLTHPDLNAVAGKTCNGTGAPSDGNGHGTHVAGTIAARNDGSGAVGVAPGSKLWAVRVLDANGSGSTSGVICGIDWVTSTRTDADPANDITVANMSLGGSAAPTENCGRTAGDPMHIAICASVAAGVTYVVAAGNSARDLQTTTPASYPEVITVAAISDADGLPGGTGGPGCVGNADDSAASYSNFATRAADVAHLIAAPGSCIRSTAPGNRYATMSGTSMAAPHVTGLVALCEGEAGARGPCFGRTPAQVTAILRKAAADQAVADPTTSFAGSPSRAIAGRVYGDLAGTRFDVAGGAPAPAPVVVAPASTAIPVVTGTAAVGGGLSVTTGAWSGTAPMTYATRWLRCTTTVATSCTEISGATAATYAPVLADAGRILRARVTATNARGSATADSLPTGTVATPPAVAPANTVAPTITGTAATGSTLTAAVGAWTGTAPIAYALQWQRCTSTLATSCSTIPGATGASYGAVSSDIGRLLRVRVSAANAKGSVSALSEPTAAVTAPAGSGPPVPTAPPTITGTVKAGETLTAGPGTLRGALPMSYVYAWASCAPGSNTCYYNGVVAPTFKLPFAQGGTRYVVVLKAQNALGIAYVQSAPTGGLSAAGVATVANIGVSFGRR